MKQILTNKYLIKIKIFCYLLCFAKTVDITVVGALYGEDKSSFAAMCSVGTINKCNF